MGHYIMVQLEAGILLLVMNQCGVILQVLGIQPLVLVLSIQIQKVMEILSRDIMPCGVIQLVDRILQLVDKSCTPIPLDLIMLRSVVELYTAIQVVQEILVLV